MNRDFREKTREIIFSNDSRFPPKIKRDNIPCLRFSKLIMDIMRTCVHVVQFKDYNLNFFHVSTNNT